MPVAFGCLFDQIDKPYVDRFSVIVCHPINIFTSLFCEQLNDAGAKVFVCPADPFSLNSPEKDDVFEATPGVKLFQDLDVHQRYQKLWTAAMAENRLILISDYNGSFIRWLVDGKEKELHDENKIFGMISTSAASQHIYRQYISAGSTKIKVPMLYVPEYLIGSQTCYYEHTWKWLKKDMRDVELASLSGKKALVVGYGENGAILAKFLKDQGVTVYVAEKNPTLGVRSCLENFSLKPLYHNGKPTDMVSEVDICLWTARHMGSCRAVVESLKPQATFLNYSGMSLADDLASSLKIVPRTQVMSRIVRPAGSYVNAALGLSPCNDPFYYLSTLMMDSLYSAELLLIAVLTWQSYDELCEPKLTALPGKLQKHLARMFIRGYYNRLGVPKPKQLRPGASQLVDPKHYQRDEAMEFAEDLRATAGNSCSNSPRGAEL